MMGMETRSTIDICQAALHDQEWSCGDMAFHDGPAIVWQVFAQRAEQRIVARAPTQAEAWSLVAKQTLKVATR
jgi:hypothetical protein